MTKRYKYEVTVCGQRDKVYVYADNLDEARKVAKQQYGVIRHVRKVDTMPRAYALRP